MSPSLKARPQSNLRFSPSGDEEAVVIKTLIEFRSASSINSRNATQVADVLSRGDIFVLISVERSVSMHGGVQVFFFYLWWCFPLLGPMLCLQNCFLIHES